MTKGQEQVVAAATLCRDLAGIVRSGGDAPDAAAMADRLEEQAGKLEWTRERLFVKMAASVKYTQACVAAAEEVKASLEGGDAADVEAKMETLVAAAAALEEKVMSPGTIVIT